MSDTHFYTPSMYYVNLSWDLFNLLNKFWDKKIFTAWFISLRSWTAEKFRNLEIWILVTLG